MRTREQRSLALFRERRQAVLSGDVVSAMMLASVLASGRTDDDPHVISLRRELKW